VLITDQTIMQHEIALEGIRFLMRRAYNELIATANVVTRAGMLGRSVMHVCFPAPAVADARETYMKLSKNKTSI
jgi:hypothetical protein